MTFIQLITDESKDERLKILFAATLAGVANSALLMLVTAVGQNPKGIELRMFVAFALACMLYVLCARFTYHRTTAMAEAALHRVKLRIVDKLQQAELAGIERIGHSEIYDRITENATVISNSAGVIANLLQSLCILAGATIYLAWLSPVAFFVLGFLLFVAVRLYVSKEKVMGDYLRQMGQGRLGFLDVLLDLLAGFKEIKFSRARAREIRADIAQKSDVLRTVTVKANHLFDDNFILASATLFALLGALVFVLPQHMSLDGKTLSKLITVVMFAWGSLTGLISGFPAYVRSNVALDQIAALERKLEGVIPAEADLATAESRDGEEADEPWQGRFTRIEAADIEYRYGAPSSGDAFRVGPLHFTITPGEIVFVVGGNGSGKSTFMKVMTGLYNPTAGCLRVDGTAVTPDNIAAYRELIAAIFTDFHLFTKTYGLQSVDEDTVNQLLVRMELDGKTAFRDGRFTKRNLSTGQRKRLALIVALLEDRPLYVFDEWAADQDPEFRRYFYEELLPMLKHKGKAVIAVSHDDRYFHCADRVVAMEYGQIRSVAIPAAAGKENPHGSTESDPAKSARR